MSVERGARGFNPLIVFGALIAVLVFAYAFLSGDGGGGRASGVALRIVSGSENKALEPIVQEWARDQGVAVEMSYLGSVDIARALEQGEDIAYDAVWPASSLWIAFGDRRHVVRHQQSILRSPVGLGLKRSIAERLGWIGREDVTIAEIQKAARDGAFRLAMTSATQSNSGASAYLGFLHAAAGGPDQLTLEMLDDPKVREQVQGLLSAVDRSSGSSGWLAEAFVAAPDRFDAMMNYEALVIEANQAFLRAGREPLYIIYPSDGLAVADSPLGFVKRAGQDAETAARREEAFLALQKHLLSAPVQDRLIALGRRAGLIGLDVAKADPKVWNPDWGIDLRRAIAPIPTPKEEVVRRALSLYQTALRKPSLTIWVLDVSGSMQGEPLAELKEAMRLLLDPEAAERNLLQPSPGDVTAVIAFNHEVAAEWRVEGDDPEQLRGLLTRVEGLRAGGNTDLYKALMRALEIVGEYEAKGELKRRLPAIVAMTDGASRRGLRQSFRVKLGRASFAGALPIHAIAFGEADEEQLEELTEATVGRLFHAGKNLAGALRNAKGYN